MRRRRTPERMKLMTAQLSFSSVVVLSCQFAVTHRQNTRGAHRRIVRSSHLIPLLFSPPSSFASLSLPLPFLLFLLFLLFLRFLRFAPFPPLLSPPLVPPLLHPCSTLFRPCSPVFALFFTICPLSVVSPFFLFPAFSPFPFTTTSKDQHKGITRETLSRRRLNTNTTIQVKKK